MDVNLYLRVDSKVQQNKSIIQYSCPGSHTMEDNGWSILIETMEDMSCCSRNIRQNTKIFSWKVHGVNGEYFLL